MLRRCKSWEVTSTWYVYAFGNFTDNSLTGVQPEQLQRQWKIMMTKEGLRKPPGIVDPDWDIKLPEEYEEE